MKHVTCRTCGAAVVALGDKLVIEAHGSCPATMLAPHGTWQYERQQARQSPRRRRRSRL